MPRRRRTARRVELDNDQLLELLFGPTSCRRGYSGERCSKPGCAGVKLLPVGDPGPNAQDVTVYHDFGRSKTIERVPLCSAFVDEVAREQAWWANRDDLIETNDGTRPFGFWLYESGLGRRPEEPEAVWLAEHDLLGPDEEANILTWGRSGAAAGTAYAVAAAVIRQRRGIRELVTERGGNA